MKVKGEAVKPLSPEASVTQPENVHRVPWNRETFLKTHTHTHTHTHQHISLAMKYNAIKKCSREIRTETCDFKTILVTKQTAVTQRCHVWDLKSQPYCLVFRDF